MIKDDEMGKACSTYRRVENTEFCWENLKNKRDHWRIDVSSIEISYST
jgi:hypothetical protein